jgi:class 3 adenylate cyclase
MTEIQTSRTLICSVVFLDIVEYSRLPVAQQIRLKEQFNALLSQSLQGIAVTDRIILDTGDGAAISLIGDPEDALLLATSFRDAVAAQPPGEASPLRIRIGINLGPVRLVKDINGQPNIIGDGINVAQRVMTFAQPAQALVSRSYYEVVSRLSDGYSKLFHYEGPRTDKNVREHEVYAVGATISRLRQRSQAKRGIASGSHGSVGLAMDYPAEIITMIKANARSKPWLATALTMIAILSVATAVRSVRDKTQKTDLPAAEVAPATRPGVVMPRADRRPAAAVSDTGQMPPPGTSPGTAPTTQPSVATQRADRKAEAAAGGNAQLTRSGTSPRAAPTTQPRVATPRTDRIPAVAAGDTGQGTSSGTPTRAGAAGIAVVNLAIAPWGEVYVDGKGQGVSPPLHDVEIAPGEHTIEVRNPGFPSHVETVNANAGEQIRIKHKFQ